MESFNKNGSYYPISNKLLYLGIGVTHHGNEEIEQQDNK